MATTPTNARTSRKRTRKPKPLHKHLHDYFIPHQGNKYTPHVFRAASLTAIVVGLVVLQAAYLAQIDFVLPKTNFLAAVLPGALISLTNSDRASNDLAPVTENSTLDQAAQDVANDMATKGYFAHVSPTGQDPWYWLNLVGYQYSFAGENLAVNFTDSDQVEAAWMQSPTHRANIEKPEYTQVGVGVANGMYQGSEATFVVEYFATPPSAGTPTTPEPPVQEAAPSPVPTGNGTSGQIALAPTNATAPPEPSQAQTEALAAKAIAEHSSAQILGAQTAPVQIASGSASNTNIASSGALAATAPTLPQAPMSPLAFLALVVTSPTQTMLYILTALAAIVLIVLLLEFVAKARFKYIEMTGGGLALLTILLGLMIFNVVTAPKVLISNDLQPVQTTASGTY